MSSYREVDVSSPELAAAWKSPATRINRSSSRSPESRSLHQSFLLNLEHGLHARPCALLVKTLRPFRCKIQVETHGHLANGHSIMGLMALAAAKGSEVAFTISGRDALQAMAAIHRLFETNFEEAYHLPVVKGLPH